MLVTLTLHACAPNPTPSLGGPIRGLGPSGRAAAPDLPADPCEEAGRELVAEGRQLDVEVTLVRADATVADLLHAVEHQQQRAGFAHEVASLPGVLVDGTWCEARTLLRDCGLRRGSAVEVLPASSTAPARPRSAAEQVATLAVTGGLLAGRRLALAPGRHVVGRSAPFHLAHPTVSRQHLLLVVDRDGSAATTDLRSRNGTKVDGRWCEPGSASREGAALAVGAVRLSLRAPEPAPSVGEVDPNSGCRTFRRAPRRDRAAAPPPLRAPEPRRPAPPRSPFAWSAAIAPLLIGLAMATVFGPLFAAFALLSPVAVVGSWAEHRLRARRHRRREDQRLEHEGRAYAAELAERRELVERAAHRAHPDLAELARRAAVAAPTLWERRPDHQDALHVRVGLADRPWTPPVLDEALPDRARNEVDTGPDPEVVAAVAESSTLQEVPATLDLGAGPVGIVGDPGVVRAVARALVLQAVALHGPADLALEVPPTAPWTWARWLPHRRHSGAEAWRLTVEDRLSPATARTTETRATERAAIEPNIVLAGTSDELPSRCVLVVEAEGTDGMGRIVDLESGSTIRGVLLDGAEEAVAASVARQLAHLCDEAADDGGAALAPLVSRTSLLASEPDEVLASWEGSHGTLPLTLGQAADGPLQLDLVHDGPHALIVGTTGSGKSELLRSLVVGLAASSAPDDLALVLVDFKGGSAFDRCADLPHVTGVVTDLDGSMVRRVLRGLESELRLREHRLRAAGADDLAAFRRRRAADEAPLPRLVIVVDEFGVLATEASEVLGGLVDVAQRGRSLGIHLVLATQRATGVVTDRIRANTSLRIALRTVDPSDSHDVIGSAEAAGLDRRHPGRALVRAGGDAPRLFQVALTSMPARAAASAPVLVEPQLPIGQPARPDGSGTLPQPDEGPTELDVLVDGIAVAFRRSGQARPRRPWTEPLPEHVALSDLPGRSDDQHAEPPSEVGRGVGPELLLGLADDPEHLRRVPWGWDPRAGHLVVHGAAGSGVTTTLATAVHALHHAGWEVHVLDPAGSLLEAVGALPAAVALAPHERDRLARLVQRLDASPAGGAARADDRPPPVAVVVDRWHAVAAALDDLDGMRLLDALVRALAAGPGAGRAAVVGLDRTTGLPAPLAPAAAQRLVLRQNDPHDLGLIGVPLPPHARELLLRCPPGRGVAAPCGLEVQVATWTDGGEPS